MGITFTGKPAPSKSMEEVMRELGYGHLYDKPKPVEQKPRPSEPLPSSEPYKEPSKLVNALAVVGALLFWAAVIGGVWAFGHYVSWIPVAIVGGIAVGAIGYMVCFSLALARHWG